MQPVDCFTWTLASRGGRQDRTGEDRTGQDRTGPERTGQGRTGHDRTGQDRTELDRKMGWTIQYLEPGDPAS
jgi:hypothetical protein